MNCVLYSSLVTKYNQISQNVDNTVHCPLTLEIEQRSRLEKLTELVKGMLLEEV